MYEWVEKLLAVQEIDLRIAKLEAQIESVPTEKAQAEDMLRRDEEAVGEERKAVQDLEKELKTFEIEVETLRRKRQDFQAKSTMIKSNEEYRAALHQIEQCGNQISAMEDRELEIMEALEEARRDLARRRKALEATKERVAEAHRDLDRRLENCERQLGALRERRGPALSEVETDVAGRYELRRSRVKPEEVDKRILVSVNGEACDRCRMNITAQIRMNARKGVAVSCEYCGAMLYHEG